MKEGIPLSDKERAFGEQNGLLMDINGSAFLTGDALKKVRKINQRSAVVDQESAQCADPEANPGFEVSADGRILRRCWENSQAWIVDKNISPQALRKLGQRNRLMLELLRQLVGEHWFSSDQHVYNIWKWLGVNCLNFDRAQDFFVKRAAMRGKLGKIVELEDSPESICEKRLECITQLLNTSLIFPFMDEKTADRVARQVPFYVVPCISWKKSGEIIFKRWLPNRRTMQNAARQAEDIWVERRPWQATLRLWVAANMDGGLIAFNTKLFRDRMKRTGKYDKRINMRLYGWQELLDDKDAQSIQLAMETGDLNRYSRLKRKAIESLKNRTTKRERQLLEAIFKAEEKINKVSPQMLMREVKRTVDSIGVEDNEEEIDMYLVTQLAIKPQYISKLRKVYMRRMNVSKTEADKMTGKQIFSALTNGQVLVDQQPLTAYDVDVRKVPNQAWISNGYFNPEDPRFFGNIQQYMGRNGDQTAKDAWLIKTYGVTLEDVKQWTAQVSDNDIRQLKALAANNALDDSQDIEEFRRKLLIRGTGNHDSKDVWCDLLVPDIINEIRAMYCQPRVRLTNEETNMLLLWERALTDILAANRLPNRRNVRLSSKGLKYDRMCENLKILTTAFFSGWNNATTYQQFNTVQTNDYNRRFFDNRWKRRDVTVPQAIARFNAERGGKDVRVFAAMVLFHIGYQTGVIASNPN
jgi:hypothetical protein